MFPQTLDDFPNPTPSTPKNSPTIPLSGAIAQLNNAVEALEGVVGVTGSTVPTSLEYRLADVQAVAVGVDSALTAHVASADDHPGYVLKDDIQIALQDVGIMRRGGVACVLFGHSFLDNENTTATFGRMIAGMRGPISILNILIGHPLELVAEEAVGGERMSDMLTRIDRVAPKLPSVIFVRMSTNDLKGTVNASPRDFDGHVYQADAEQTNLMALKPRAEQIIDTLLRTGAQMIYILGDCAPDSGAGQSKYEASRQQLMNRYFSHLCQTKGAGQLRYVPIDQVRMDPTDAAMGGVADRFVDTIHNSYKGAWYEALFLKNQIGAELTQRFYHDRLIFQAGDTYTNLKIAATSLQSTGGIMTVFLANGSGYAYNYIQKGDTVALHVPNASGLQFGGTYRVLSHSDTQITMACAVEGSYTGTINVSAAANMFDNPLFTTTTGGSATGSGSVTGNVPANVEINVPAGSTCTVTTTPHTDASGAATGFGNWFECSFSLAAGTEAGVIFYLHRELTANTYQGRLYPGDVVVTDCDFELLNSPTITNLDRLQHGLRITCTDSAGTSLSSGEHAELMRESGDTDAHPMLPFRGVLRPVPWKSPSGGASTLGRVDARTRIAASAGGTCTVKMRWARLRGGRESDTISDPAASRVLR